MSAKFCEKIAIAGGGVLRKSTWFLGGKPKNHDGPQGGGGVKNGRKSVNMVYGCRLGQILGILTDSEF